MASDNDCPCCGNQLLRDAALNVENVMSDFVFSILVSIGIIVIAARIVAWLTIRRIKTE